MTPEQLEIAITHYLDGTLPAEESGALELRLAGDPAARALLDEHRALTTFLRSEALPEMDWAEVARDLAAVVTGTVSEASRVEDQKLNAVLKAATPLPQIRWEALSRRISDAVDAEVATTGADDESFDEMLRAASPAPAVNWDRLASHLSRAVAAEEQAHVVEAPAVIGRIGFGRKFASFAVAAVVLIATGIGLNAYRGQNHGTPGSNGGTAGPVVAVNTEKPVLDVTVASSEDSKDPAVAEVSIGPSKSYAASDPGYQRVAGSRSPVVIVTPVGPGAERQDDWEPWLGVE